MSSPSLLDEAAQWERLVCRRNVLSPLRYPGGKRRLVPYVAAALAANGLKPKLLVEPFAGGASVSLELAAIGAVEQIGIADADPLVAAFWQTVFEDCDWLCRQVENIDVDLPTWRRMKETRWRGRRQRALACLFLNRTSFNGTLHPRAGPIGGHSGSSAYPLDCRFPRKRLIKRMRDCEQLASEGKVAFARQGSAFEVIGASRLEYDRDGLFFYFDPPFWAKSQTLYRRTFAELDHRNFAHVLRWVNEPWLLSYDVAAEITALYEPLEEVQVRTVELLYMGSQRTAGEELVVTNLKRLPGRSRLWRTAAEWTVAKAGGCPGMQLT
ncbi:MAG: adenine methylase [Thermoleophilaceae bacterium]|nr:adenine methylase [Thermoleophilaceae bacterium]